MHIVCGLQHHLHENGYSDRDGSKALIGGGGGRRVYIYIIRFYATNYFEIRLISKELIGQNLNI